MISALMRQKRLLRLERLRYADHAPVCIETTYLAECDRAWLDPRRLGSLYRLLAKYGKTLVRSEELVRVRAATAREARLLRIERRAPVIEIRRLASDRRGQPLEFTINVLRADRYAFRLELQILTQARAAPRARASSAPAPGLPHPCSSRPRPRRG